MSQFENESIGDHRVGKCCKEDFVELELVKLLQKKALIKANE
jgi:hypothetical protein